MVDSCDNEDLDLREAFSATAGELDPLARERLLGHVQELGDQAVVQETWDLSAAGLDDLAARRLLAHAKRTAERQTPAQAAGRRPRWTRRVAQSAAAIAATAALVAGARWWAGAGGGAPAAITAPPMAAVHLPDQGVNSQPEPADAAEAMAAALPVFGEGSAGDQGPWEGPYVESDELVTTDLAGQLDSLHGMEASPLDEPTSEWL